ncbi:MAG: Lrp/AsnC family transcriptional regulator [Candidatus Nezhaarchaeota archaeon]|nr:Lrp/AsnC family transcriptional regulator [Candidatus Nezhaarchaeota archaeon]
MGNKGPTVLDERDLAILTLYSKNPEVSQEQIARELGISQPAVAMRVKRLRGLGILQFRAGVDPSRAGLHLAKVDASVTNVGNVLAKFMNCPYFVSGFVTTGRSNLCLLFMAEDVSTLESIVDNHLRVSEGVQDVEFNIVVSTAGGFVAPFKLHAPAGERQPCGSAIACKDCRAFREGLCRGCPILVKGRLSTKRREGLS